MTTTTLPTAPATPITDPTSIVLAGPGPSLTYLVLPGGHLERLERLDRVERLEQAEPSRAA